MRAIVGMVVCSGATLAAPDAQGDRSRCCLWAWAGVVCSDAAQPINGAMQPINGAMQPINGAMQPIN
ncbi:MAG TPA: hypothetical protein PKK15_13095, partial [Kouleothrix sp.]|nr:hypothetical protein [Kouleothrix sp.]